MASDHLTFTRWLAGVLLRWRLIAVITILSIVGAVAASFIVPPVYRAKASFVANSSSASKLPGVASSSPGVGGLISQLGGSLGGDPSESPNFYIQLFESRELLTRVAQSRFPN
ncbi:MAG TPA: Wzz/FepE/Etk N-terminal domain-containing protein, partial [Gemmatimonadaceae bacterium]|nr:Wzz/FepE/Etk N-terminal domain-containing protein [Gemmatimonadaceae bacterium]